MAYSVNIPAFLIDRDHSDALTKAIINGEHVVLAAHLELPKATGASVDFELWYSSIYDLPLQLMIDLYEYEHAFGENVRFYPKLVSFGCPTCPEEIRRKDCLADGQYCLLPPRGDTLASELD